MKTLERLFVDSKLGVHLLVCVFAISSWVDINGLWMQLSTFVAHLPEQWKLPSYITILSQIANIGPIIFFIVAYCIPARNDSVTKLCLDKVTSYIIMFVGLTSTVLLAFLWKRTAYVAGSEHSVALLALSFFLSLMDCTSSVAYVAFMSALKPAYMSSFFIGEGLSGMLPAVMVIIQGSGKVVCVNGSSTQEKNESGVLVNVTSYFEYPTYTSARFSVEVFILILSGMIAMSVVAFTLLNFWGYCKDEFVAVSSFSLEEETTVQKNGLQPEEPVEGLGIWNSGFKNSSSVANGSKKSVNVSKDISSVSGSVKSGSGSGSGSGSYGSYDSVSPLQSSSGGNSEGEMGLAKKSERTTTTIVFLLAQVVVINFLITGFLLTIQVYSSLPYGMNTYRIVTVVGSFINPVACLICMFFTASSPLAISVLTSLGAGCCAYIIVAASMSPEPVLIHQSAGGPVMVFIWVGAIFFLTYAKVSVAGVMRQMGRRALIWYGVATQIGALIGALLGFVLVTEIEVFKQAPWC